jgi:tripartite ATP-independent transporter DctM subunit
MADMSVGRLLIALIVPGILMAVVLAIYIVGRCWLQPSIAPTYSAGNFSFLEKVEESAKYVLPMALIVFLVTGIIFLGIATPSEAAATGCLGSFILAATYRKLNWKVIKISTTSSLRAAVMVMIIMASAAAYSQILVFSGANEGLVNFLMGLRLPPIAAVIGIQILIAIMGCFMPVAGILMISLPLFTPVVAVMGMDPIWFGVITLINCEMAGLTPPFGTNLFTMKAVAPKGTTLEEIYKAALPIVGIDIFVMGLLLGLPILTQWLPRMMR